MNIPLDQKIHLIKIDIEDGEFRVLKRAKGLIKLHKPIIIFEYEKKA